MLAQLKNTRTNHLYSPIKIIIHLRKQPDITNCDNITLLSLVIRNKSQRAYHDVNFKSHF